MGPCMKIKPFPTATQQSTKTHCADVHEGKTSPKLHSESFQNPLLELSRKKVCGSPMVLMAEGRSGIEPRLDPRAGVSSIVWSPIGKCSAQQSEALSPFKVPQWANKSIVTKAAALTRFGFTMQNQVFMVRGYGLTLPASNMCLLILESQENSSQTLRNMHPALIASSVTSVKAGNSLWKRDRRRQTASFRPAGGACKWS